MSTDGHEELHVRLGPRSGLQLAVAVHSTALGPALGGARLWGYKSPGDAVADSLRLSEAMTLKAAAAGLDLGGGKSALCAPGEMPAERRRALMLDLGDLVESLDGRYVVAEDVGTTTDDMTVIAERTSHVVGLPAERGGTGDPSPSTARGVAAAMRAACSRRLGTADLSGVRVCIIGLGHVGTALAKILAGEGAKLLVSDIRSEHRAVGAELGATWLDPGDATGAECDVLAPCALGGAIAESAAEILRCSVVCGSANNQLADESLSHTLHRRGILYTPDFIANAGGLINVYAELRSLPSDRVARLVEGIGDTVAEVLDDAESCGLTPLDSALDLARARLEAARPRAPARLSA
ncbi:MAG: ldh [Solirubrobacterales bacterium]|nr:ldh [Solirubrobacterales bacterium]